ncbi:unnamed protein product [Symbiodinium sp. CCMP2592]|nr:unnamed protein product [Symbiodinium sp. CCMP2592]
MSKQKEPRHPALADLVGLAEVACGFLVQPVLPDSCKLLWHAKLARSGFMLKAALGSLCAGPLRRLARDLSADPPSKGDASARRTEASEDEDGNAEPCASRKSPQHQEAREEEEVEEEEVGEEEEVEEEEEEEEGEEDKSESDKAESQEAQELCMTEQKEAASLGPESAAGSAEELNNLSQGIMELVEELQMAQDVKGQTAIAGPEHENFALASPCKNDLDGEDGYLDISDRSGPPGSRPAKMPMHFRGQCKVSQWFRQRRRKRMRFPEPRTAVELPQKETKKGSDEVARVPEASNFMGATPRASAIPCLRRPRRGQGRPPVKAPEVCSEVERGADLRDSAEELGLSGLLALSADAAHTVPKASPKRRRKKPKQQSWMSVSAEASEAISGLADWLLSLQNSIERDVKVMDVPQLADFFGPSTAQPLRTLRGRGSEKHTGSKSSKQKSRAF